LGEEVDRGGEGFGGLEREGESVGSAWDDGKICRACALLRELRRLR